QQLHGVADQPTTSLERHVPVQPKVLAVDVTCEREAGAALALHIAVWTLQRHNQRHLARHIANGEIAGDAVLVLAEPLDLGALIGEGWILLNSEEVRGAQVPIAPLLASIQARYVNGDIHPRLLGLLLVEVHRAAELLEAPTHRRDHHMLDG